MKVVYVAGRFSAPDQWQRARNVRAAENLAFAVAEAGAMPLNPLANTCNFYGTLSEDNLWYPGTLELLRRCDAIILVPGWEGSKGVTAEIAEAKRLDIPVFERVEGLKTWLSLKAVATCPRASWCRLPAGHDEVECLPKPDNWRAWMEEPKTKGD